MLLGSGTKTELEEFDGEIEDWAASGKAGVKINPRPDIP